MGRTVGGALVLALGLSVAAGQDARTRPAAPAEQYKAILKEFGEAAHANWTATTDEERKRAAARVEPLPLKLLELAEKNPKEPWTLDALTQVITQEYWLDNYSSHPGWGKDSRQARAIAILLRDHVHSDKLGETCKRAQYGFRKECETFLRTVLEKNPHKDVRGQAYLGLGLFLNGRLNRLDLLKDQPDVSKRYEGLYGKDYLDALRRQDRAKAVAEVEAVFEQAAEKYGDVKLPFGGRVGDNAKMELFAIRHLAVGKEAPAIEGPDQNGVRFKLSDYRGKVVFLYFWQQG
jgi:AhpC/TSA family